MRLSLDPLFSFQFHFVWRKKTSTSLRSLHRIYMQAAFLNRTALPCAAAYRGTAVDCGGILIRVVETRCSRPPRRLGSIFKLVSPALCQPLVIIVEDLRSRQRRRNSERERGKERKTFPRQTALRTTPSPLLGYKLRTEGDQSAVKDWIIFQFSPKQQGAVRFTPGIQYWRKIRHY